MFFVAPCFLAVTMIAIHFEMPCRLAFRLTRSKMEKIAIAQLNTPESSRTVRHVGIYGSCEFFHDGNTVMIEVQGAVLNRYGFAYCPVGKPAVERMHPIGGPWYEWWIGL
jgi:hypothetical protein